MVVKIDERLRKLKRFSSGYNRLMQKSLWGRIPPPRISRTLWFFRYVGSALMGVVSLVIPEFSINLVLSSEGALYWSSMVIMSGIGGALFVFSSRFIFERLFLIMMTGPWMFYAGVQTMYIFSDIQQYGGRFITLYLVLNLLVGMFDRYVRIYGWDEVEFVSRGESR